MIVYNTPEQEALHIAQEKVEAAEQNMNASALSFARVCAQRAFNADHAKQLRALKKKHLKAFIEYEKEYFDAVKKAGEAFDRVYPPKEKTP